MWRAFNVLAAHPWISCGELAGHCRWLPTEAGYVLLLLWTDGIVGRRRATEAQQVAEDGGAVHGVGVHGRAWLYCVVSGRTPPRPLTLAKG